MTTGRLTLVEVIAGAGRAEDDVLRLAALATLLLSGLLYLIFRAAHRRLGQQTDALLAAGKPHEVLPLVEKQCGVKLTSAPGRGR